MWIIKQIITFIRFALPHTIKLIFHGMSEAMKIVFLVNASFFQNLNWLAGEIAIKWVEDALINGFPTLWERQLKTFFLVLAYISVLSGWLLTWMFLYMFTFYTLEYLKSW